MKMVWFLPSVLMFLVTSSTVMETDAGEPSVYHIHSPKGNFFMAPNMTISSAQAHYILTKDVKNCTCKSACFAVACKAWSLVKLDNGTVECRLASAGPGTIVPVVNPNATYFFREDSIAGIYSFQQGDNLLYVELTANDYFDVGKQACENIPGHRLMILKTLVQYQYFQSLWLSHTYFVVAVDLQKNGTERVWGDGTLFTQTELTGITLNDDQNADANIYTNYQGQLHDNIRNLAYTIICQANPFGVEW